MEDLFYRISSMKCLGRKRLLTLKSKVENLCQWNVQIGLRSRVSLLKNSFTTFSRFSLSVCSLWNFKSARDLNLTGNIVDRSQVFRFLANENILSAVALVAELTATSLMTLIMLGTKIKSSVGSFFICCLTSSKHLKCLFCYIAFNIWSSTTSWLTSRSPL